MNKRKVVVNIILIVLVLLSVGAMFKYNSDKKEYLDSHQSMYNSCISRQNTSEYLEKLEPKSYDDSDVPEELQQEYNETRRKARENYLECVENNGCFLKCGSSCGHYENKYSFEIFIDKLFSTGICTSDCRKECIYTIEK